MTSLQAHLEEYRKQLRQGSIQQAYRGLMEYMLDLKTQLKVRHPGHVVSGSLYFGYMDMTYFSFTPASLQRRRLKIAVVFLHEAFRFEAWLGAANKRIQEVYWKRIRESGWSRYRLVPSVKGADSILEHVLAENPDFRDPAALTRKIENGTLKFIRDVEGFLAGASR